MGKQFRMDGVRPARGSPLTAVIDEFSRQIGLALELDDEQFCRFSVGSDMRL
jgi:hypothetical protein